MPAQGVALFARDYGRQDQGRKGDVAEEGGGRPRHKKLTTDLEDEYTGFSTFVQCGNTNEGTEELQRIMGAAPFIFPKPRSLVETLIAQTTGD